MYRLRSIYNLLDGHKELENQEIYFAPSVDLNDPMEGFLDVFWQGDSIVWENLLKHFLMCFEQIFVLNIIAGETREINKKEIPVFKNRSTYLSNEAKEIYSKLESNFFSHSYINSLLENLNKRSSPVRRDELITYLKLVHIYAIQSIKEVYKEYGLVNMNANEELFNELEKYIKENDQILDTLEGVEKEYSKNSEILTVFFSVATKVSNQLNLLTAFNNIDLPGNSNKFFLFYEFSESYVSRIEEMVYPDWYTACFMTCCSNSSVWGHYGEQHKGVCLKFKTQTFGEEIQFKVERINGYGESGPTKGMMPHTFYKVNYENKHVEIDFFKSLGRLQVFILKNHWYTDGAGKMSKCAEPITNDSELNDNWHSNYWKRFYKGVTTKMEDWSYENEYRLILTNMLNNFCSVDSRKLKYDFSSLDGIIFGIKTTTENKLKIIKIIEEKCKKYNRSDFKFYQAYYCNRNGKIEYELLDLIKLEKDYI